MTLQEIQERYFEITDDWAAEDPKQQWTSVAELDDMLHELAWILRAFEGVAACEIAKVPVLQGQ